MNLAEGVMLGTALLSTATAGMAAWSAAGSRSAAESLNELERARDRRERHRRLRPKLRTSLCAFTSRVPAGLVVFLDGPDELADEFDDLKVWVVLDDDPTGRKRTQSAEEIKQGVHQFWSPWRFITPHERSVMESHEEVVRLGGALVAQLEPTPRITELYDDEEWGKRLFTERLVVEIGAKLDGLVWWDRRELTWDRTYGGAID